MRIKSFKIKLAVLSLSAFLLLGTALTTPSSASEPFLGEIMTVGFNFAPRGWAFCDGQILPINQYQSLYSLLGTMYGGDGRTSFALPDLRGRMALHIGSGHTQGSSSGLERVPLTEAQLPAHSHALRASSSQGTDDRPVGHSLAYDRRENQYSEAAPEVSMGSDAVLSAGGSQSHENMPPFIVINHCIAIQGLFPSRN